MNDVMTAWKGRHGLHENDMDMKHTDATDDHEHSSMIREVRSLHEGWTSREHKIPGD